MAQLIVALLFPMIVSIGILFSWQMKKKKTERQKTREIRVTVFYNPAPQDSALKRQPPILIRMPKMIE
jgi:hypothetical protein